MAHADLQTPLEDFFKLFKTKNKSNIFVRAFVSITEVMMA